MKKKNWFLALIFTALVCLYSCTKDKTTTGVVYNCISVDTATNYYSSNANDPKANISNIINLYCAYAPCHGQGSIQQGVDLSTYSSTVSAFETKNVICALKGTGCIQMPNGGTPLPDSLILQLECWQQSGYPEK